MPTTEAGISTMGLSQLYVSMGDETADGGLVVRVWWKPLVTLIWGGTVAMMAGGAVSLFDRRLRVGAPAKSRKVKAGRHWQRPNDAPRPASLVVLALLFPAPLGRQCPARCWPIRLLEARARALSAQLRCMVCQNQSIDDSDAELARDLRVIVRERLAAGDSDGK
jgi:hypothetical protein